MYWVLGESHLVKLLWFFTCVKVQHTVLNVIFIQIFSFWNSLRKHTQTHIFTDTLYFFNPCVVADGSIALVCSCWERKPRSCVISVCIECVWDCMFERECVRSIRLIDKLITWPIINSDHCCPGKLGENESVVAWKTQYLSQFCSLKSLTLHHHLVYIYVCLYVWGCTYLNVYPLLPTCPRCVPSLCFTCTGMSPSWPCDSQVRWVPG